jgi:hypothetical protein
VLESFGKTSPEPGEARMVVYVCDSCPLIFRVGGYGYWDCSGGEEQVVCYNCGTMHRLVKKGKDCRVFALAGPLRSTDIDASHPPDSAWRLVGKAAGLGAWRQLRCGACRQDGHLRSRKHLPQQSEYPEEPVCPLCREPVRCVLCGVIN